jgi:hypothetical protein
MINKNPMAIPRENNAKNELNIILFKLNTPRGPLRG